MNKRIHLRNMSLIIVLGLLLYSNTLQNTFQFDDNRMIESIATYRSVKKFIPSGLISRTLPQLSFFLTYRLSRFTTVWFHLGNILNHIIIAILVYWIFYLLLQHDYSNPPSSRSSSGLRQAGKTTDYSDETADVRGRRCEDSDNMLEDEAISTQITADRQSPYTFSLITALLFVTHPLCTESVNYIIARYAQFAVIFSLLGLLFFILYFQNKSKKIISKFYLLGTILSFFATLHSKEVGIPYFISGIFLYFWFFGISEEKFLEWIKKKIWLLVSFFLLFFLVCWYATPIKKRIVTTGLAEIGRYFLIENKIFFYYMRLMLFPYFGLNVDHHILWPESLISLSTILFLVLNIFFLYFSFYLKRRNKIISFGLFWVYLFLLPYFFIVSVELMVEYRVYPAIIGFVAILAYLFEFYIQKKKIKIISFTLLVLSFFVATFLRNLVWINPTTLWSDAVKKSPNKPRARSNLGTAYILAEKYNEAIEEFSKAIRLNPRAVEPHANLALVYAMKGETDLAIEEYKRTLNLGVIDMGQKAKLLRNLGSLYATKKEFTLAIEEYRKALEINSSAADIYHEVGLIYYQLNDDEKAISNFNKAIEIHPGYAQAYNSLGILYDLNGNYDSAIAAYKKAIKNSHNYAEAYYNLGISYENKNLLDEAIQVYQEALKINPHYAKVYNNLGNIYYKKGEYEKAIENYRKAIIFDPTLVTAYNNLGTVYTEKKMYNEAEEIFEKILEIDPKNKEAKNNLQEAKRKLRK